MTGRGGLQLILPDRGWQHYLYERRVFSLIFLLFGDGNIIYVTGEITKLEEFLPNKKVTRQVVLFMEVGGGNLL